MALFAVREGGGFSLSPTTAASAFSPFVDMKGGRRYFSAMTAAPDASVHSSVACAVTWLREALPRPRPAILAFFLAAKSLR